MRLNKEYNRVIKQCAYSVFGANCSVALFGSRLDDAGRGGDIDLFIKVESKDNLFEKKIKFLSKLKRTLGEQRIDVVFDTDASRLIEQEARRCAIAL
jgi:uncharacterized protein